MTLISTMTIISEKALLSTTSVSYTHLVTPICPCEDHHTLGGMKLPAALIQTMTVTREPFSAAVIAEI